MDLNVISKSYGGYRFILCKIDEVTNYLITIPAHQAKSEEVGSALKEILVLNIAYQKYINMDQDSAFMSSLINYLFHKFDITIETVVPDNHQSLQAEHGIKSLLSILTKPLTNLG